MEVKEIDKEIMLLMIYDSSKRRVGRMIKKIRRVEREGMIVVAKVAKIVGRRR